VNSSPRPGTENRGDWSWGKTRLTKRQAEKKDTTPHGRKEKQAEGHCGKGRRFTGREETSEREKNAYLEKRSGASETRVGHKGLRMERKGYWEKGGGRGSFQDNRGRGGCEKFSGKLPRKKKREGKGGSSRSVSERGDKE